MDFIWETGKAPRSSITEQIKINRKISQQFLESSYKDLPDINLLKDLSKAAERIIEAIGNKERIMIYGHDDMDGITSTYILFDYLEKIGSQHHYYHIPNRLKDSHGIQDEFISKLKNMKIDLLITVDGGISEFKAVEKIKGFGCDVIITDHHIVQDSVPSAYAVVNPKQVDCNYPFDMVAGVTISFFLVFKLSETLNIAPEKEYLFWVSVGSISDKVPMRGVNRILIKKVLDEWNVYSSKKLLYLDDNFSSARNHSSRMGVIRNLIKLLSSYRDKDGLNTALSFMLSNGNKNDNSKNRLLNSFAEQEQKLGSVKQWLQDNFKNDFNKAFVYYDKYQEIPVELLGVCATYISKTYLIPAVFLKKKNGVIACEARSTKGFDLIKAFRNCHDILIQYGGHKQAAGFTMHEKNLDDFIACFRKYVDDNIDEIKNNKRLLIDAVISTEDKDELEQFSYTDYHFFQPYGEENQTPLILLKDFNPVKDKEFFELIKFQKMPDPELTYDLVLKVNSSSIQVVDSKEYN